MLTLTGAARSLDVRLHAVFAFNHSHSLDLHPVTDPDPARRADPVDEQATRAPVELVGGVVPALDGFGVQLALDGLGDLELRELSLGLDHEDVGIIADLLHVDLAIHEGQGLIWVVDVVQFHWYPPGYIGYDIRIACH